MPNAHPIRKGGPCTLVALDHKPLGRLTRTRSSLRPWPWPARMEITWYIGPAGERFLCLVDPGVAARRFALGDPTVDPDDLGACWYLVAAGIAPIVRGDPESTYQERTARFIRPAPRPFKGGSI